MRAPEFWKSPPGLRAALLSPASLAWSAAGRLRAALAQPYRADVPVICVGNLVAGGSGKTPVVVALADRFRAEGVAVHIVSRGYGGALPGPVRVDPQHHDAAAVGDEPLILAGHAPCWVARDRAAGIRAAASGGARLVLLDDGLQNPTVEKDLSLLVADAGYGFGNGRVIPAGPLRERPASGIARSNAVVLIGDGDPPAVLRDCSLPTMRADLVPLCGDRFAGRRLAAFAGIGRPEKFFAMLAALGAPLAFVRAFADHHVYTRAEIDALRRDVERQGATLVTTAKDWARLPAQWRSGIEVLEVELRWRDPAHLDAFVKTFIQAIESEPANRRSSHPG